MMPASATTDATPPKENSTAVSAGAKGSSSRGFLCWALSIFFLGLGMKLLMMQRCINPLPYFDQWEAEGMAIYVPYYEHALTIADFFHPQNEHRIFLTHVYDLALLLLNRQWDSQLQMVLNAIIHSATLAGFGCLMAYLLGRRYWPFIWLPLALAATASFTWENALCGFQSQFYFLLLFSLLTIWLLGGEPLSKPWKWGVLAGVVALLTMASGLLAAAAVAAVVILEIGKNPPAWRRYLPTLGVCVALIIAGLLLVGKTPEEGHSTAASLKAFFTSLGNNLSWPTGLWPRLAPLNLFPLLLLGWICLRSPGKLPPAERVILGLGIWTILQSVATAVARGAGGAPPAWRYMDTLCFLFTANVLSIALLAGKYRSRLWFPPIWYAAFAVWLAPCLYSLWGLQQRGWNEVIPTWARYQQARLNTMRAYMATGDEAILAHGDYRNLPWNYVPGFIFLLHTKDIPPILPACARIPLKVVPAGNAASVFVPGGSKLNTPDPPTEHCLGSYSQNGDAARGTFESAPLTSSLPYLEIPVAGNLGRPGLSLRLVELDSGKVFDIKPDREPGGQWVNLDVKAPAGKFKLVARDDSSTGWFAFKEPRELGRLSFWAAKIIGAARYFLAAGFISLAVALGLFSLPGSRRKNPNSFTPVIA